MHPMTTWTRPLGAATWSRPVGVRDRGARGAAPAGVGLHGAGGCVATQDTVTQLVAAIRRVRRLIPAARAVKLDAHDYDRPGKPDCDWDDSDAKQALVSGLVNDALAVLAAVATPSWAPARTWRRASGRGPSGSPGASPATG